MNVRCGGVEIVNQSDFGFSGNTPQEDRYELIVIGAGIAGMVAAVTAAGLGKRVAVVEKDKVGGNCTNLTCIPSKTLIHLSHLHWEMAHPERLGLRTAAASGFDTSSILQRIRSIVQEAYEKDRPETFEDIGIQVLTGNAAFLDRHHVRVSGSTFFAEKFIIASGTVPLVPPIDGLQDVDYLTNENLSTLENLPSSIIVLGGGVDGLEHASAFARLGIETTVVELGTRLLPMADREVVNRLLSILRTNGVRFQTGSKAVRFRDGRDHVVLTVEQPDGNAAEISAEKVLVTAGRKPDLDELSVEKAGVHRNSKGIITDSTLRTSSPNIYACGDVVGPYQLASTAEAQGIVAATNAILPFKRKIDYTNNVYVVFTEPPLAYIGLTEEEALKTYGHKLKVYRFDYSNMRRALIDGAREGMAKFVLDGRGRIAGAHILGVSAPETIHEVQVIKAFRKPLHALQSITHAYPTYAQALVGRASQLAFLDRMAENPFVDLALKLIPGCSNRLSLARDRLAETHTSESDTRETQLALTVNLGTTPTRNMHVSASHQPEERCAIHLPQELTDYDEVPFVLLIENSGSNRCKHLVLDFSDVQKINSFGACMLLKLSVHCMRRGIDVSAREVSGAIQEILAATELDTVIRVIKNGTDVDSLEQTVDRNPSKYWMRPVTELLVPLMPIEARNLNVHGRRPVGPVSGFGQLWQKTFRLHIHDSSITPTQAFAELKHGFIRFQPSFNRFYASESGIQPGAIVLINASTPGGPVSTGVVILYADESLFTFATPLGHPECGWVSFAVFEQGNQTIVQILGLARSGDPVYEGAFKMAGARVQRRIWTHVLRALAAHLGIPAEITVDEKCIDTGMQWSQAKNVWYNAQIRTLLNEPVRWYRTVQESVSKRS